MENETREQKEFKKHNYEVTVNPNSACGLDGLPDYMEKWALTCFTKEELMEDPGPLLQCMFEAEQLKNK
jgi:hypothetical protein